MAMFAVLDWPLSLVEALMVLLIPSIVELTVVVMPQLLGMMLKVLCHLELFAEEVAVVLAVWMMMIQVASLVVVAALGYLFSASSSAVQSQR